MSRLESGRHSPRLVDVTALLDFYASVDPDTVTYELREQLLKLAADCWKKQWFDPFRDVLSGNMTPDHMQRYIEYESDATEVRNYEPELIPGLLQTREYALATVEIFYPGNSPAEHRRLTDFRIARQDILKREPEPLSFYAAVSESALHRTIGGTAVHREQLQSLIRDLEGARPNVALYIVPAQVTLPAALGGPFVHLSLGANGEKDLVYLETRSGGDYLTDEASAERFALYFDGLVEASLPAQESIDRINQLL